MQFLRQLVQFHFSRDQMHILLVSHWSVLQRGCPLFLGDGSNAEDKFHFTTFRSILVRVNQMSQISISQPVYICYLITDTGSNKLDKLALGLKKFSIFIYL